MVCDKVVCERWCGEKSWMSKGSRINSRYHNKLWENYIELLQGATPPSVRNVCESKLSVRNLCVCE